MFICVFAIFAIQIWRGDIHYRCRETLRPVDGDWKVVKGDFSNCGGFKICEEENYCGSLYETYLPDLDNLG